MYSKAVVRHNEVTSTERLTGREFVWGSRVVSILDICAIKYKVEVIQPVKSFI